MDPGNLMALITATAQRYGLPPDKFLAQLRAESNLDPGAVSPKGAIGVAQLMPATAASLGVDPRDPAQAVDAAGRYMRMNLDRFGGNYDMALAAYNWGPGNVAKYGISGMPPETRAYIQKVSGASGDGGVTAPKGGGLLARTGPGQILGEGPLVAPRSAAALGNPQPAQAPQVASNYVDPRSTGLADLLLGMGKNTKINQVA